METAGAYERVGIWREDGIGNEAGTVGDRRGEVDAEEMKAMEEGRDLNDVVDERVLEMQRRWVSWCGLRGVGIDLLEIGVFGWMFFRRRS